MFRDAARQLSMHSPRWLNIFLAPEPSAKGCADYARGAPVQAHDQERDCFFESEVKVSTSPDPMSSTQDEEIEVASVGSYGGHGPSSYRHNDSYLLQRVCETLIDHADVDASACCVDVLDGIVTLEGDMRDATMRCKAEELVSSVVGIAKVVNTIRVHPR